MLDRTLGRILFQERHRESLHPITRIHQYTCVITQRLGNHLDSSAVKTEERI